MANFFNTLCFYVFIHIQHSLEICYSMHRTLFIEQRASYLGFFQTFHIQKHFLLFLSIVHIITTIQYEKVPYTCLLDVYMNNINNACISNSIINVSAHTLRLIHNEKIHFSRLLGLAMPGKKKLTSQHLTHMFLKALLYISELF